MIPFITEALWQALTGNESLVIADWPRSSGVGLDQVATQRITDMQKLVTEVRRFRSDQGLADRQKVPARLAGVTESDLDTQVSAVTSLAWLTDAGPDFRPSASVEVRLRGGTVVVELDTSGSIDVAAERRRLEKDLAAAHKELASTTAKLANEDFLAKGAPARRRQDPGPTAAGAGGKRADQRAAGSAAMTEPPDWAPEHDVPDPVPTPDEIAALLQVEHLLDQRWPETKIEPSLTRISALLDLLGSPQRAYPSIHVAGTNGKTSVARMIDALVTALHRRTGRTTSPHLQSAVERISIDAKPISPARYVDTYREIEPFVQMVDQQSQAAGDPR